MIDSLQMRTAIHSLSGNQIVEGKSLASKQGHQEYKQKNVPSMALSVPLI